MRAQYAASKSRSALHLPVTVDANGIVAGFGCKAFNAATQAQQGMITPVIITVYADRSFTFVTKTPPASVLLKKAAGLEKGSAAPGKTKVGKVTRAQVRQIAELKLKDLTAKDLAAAEKSVEGTARSLGLEVEG